MKDGLYCPIFSWWRGSEIVGAEAGFCLFERCRYFGTRRIENSGKIEEICRHKKRSEINGIAPEKQKARSK